MRVDRRTVSGSGWRVRKPLVALAVFALAFLGACGGGEGSVLTAQEYAEAMADAYAASEEDAEQIGEDLDQAFEDAFDELQEAPLPDDGSWSDENARVATDFAETLLRLYGEVIERTRGVLEDWGDEISSLRPPAHLAELHDAMIAAVEQLARELRRAEDGLEDVDTDIDSEAELEDFWTAVQSVLDADSGSRAGEQLEDACQELQASLEAELGANVAICEVDEARESEPTAQPAVATPPGRPTDTGDDHGDSTAEATDAAVGDPATGVLNHREDADYFAFVAERGERYEIEVALGTLDDSVAALYDAGGWELEYDDDGGEFGGSRIVWTAAESGTHYVAVAGWGSRTGSYTLTVSAMGDAPDTSAPDTGDDHGDSIDDATVATVGDPVTGVVSHREDIDTFAFVAERGERYEIEVALGTLDDSVAALYDAGGWELEYDDDGGNFGGSRIVWAAAETGIYYVAVAGWGGDTGSYTLTISATGEAPDSTGDPGDSTVDADEPGADADTSPEAPATDRTDFEASTPAGYTAVTLRTSGSVWGVPSRHTTDSNDGVVAYVLLGSVKGCAFADAEAVRGSRVYIKTQELGRLTNYTSESVCQKRTSTWQSWDGRRITHIRFFDESEPTNVGEYVYDAAGGQYVQADGALDGPGNPDEADEAAPVGSFAPYPGDTPDERAAALGTGQGDTFQFETRSDDPYRSGDDVLAHGWWLNLLDNSPPDAEVAVHLSAWWCDSEGCRWRRVAFQEGIIAPGGDQRITARVTCISDETTGFRSAVDLDLRNTSDSSEVAFTIANLNCRPPGH